MCLSSGHALQGAATAYGTTMLVSLATGHEWSWWFPHVAAGITAGWALWPDIDTLKATVTTSLGFITRSLHEVACHAAALTYYATRTDKDPADKPRIHRGVTHTWPGALFMGMLVAIVCLLWPRYATPIILGISLHWGMRGLAIPKSAHGVPKGNAAGRFLTVHAYTALRVVPQPGRIFDGSIRYISRKWLGLSGKWVRTSSFLVCEGIAWLMTEATPDLHTLVAILTLAGLVTQGCLVHMVGDSITESGICWKFPFIDKATGKRWAETKLPQISITLPWWIPKFGGTHRYKTAFKTGRAFEIAVVYPVCILACLALAPGGWTLLSYMGELATAWRHRTTAAAALTLTPWPTTNPASPRTTLLAQ